MKIYEVPKPCPNCGFEVNYADSRDNAKNDNYCPHCRVRINYSIKPNKKDYMWEIPVVYGAMTELIKRQNDGDN